MMIGNDAAVTRRSLAPKARIHSAGGSRRVRRILPSWNTKALAGFASASALVVLFLLTALTATSESSRSPATPLHERASFELVPPGALLPRGLRQEALRSLASRHGRRMGAAVSVQPLRFDTQYQEILIREFSALTPENAMKFGVIHPQPAEYAFSDADRIMAFAEDNDLKVRGHTLVWHQQLPAWLTPEMLTPDELLTILHDHITTIVSRYRGRIMAWDVVNEAVASDGSLRDTIWLRALGPDYLDLAFRWARAGDPEAKLFYNDFGGDGMGRKSDAIYTLVRNLKDRGVPIDGVGLQMHVSLDQAPTYPDVLANMDRLAALGMQIHVTEMDVRIDGTPSAQQLARQSQIYENVLRACLQVTVCDSFAVWGVSDSHSWIPIAFPGFGSALLFDTSYIPKPAYYGLLSVLRGDSGIASMERSTHGQ